MCQTSSNFLLGPSATFLHLCRRIPRFLLFSGFGLALSLCSHWRLLFRSSIFLGTRLLRRRSFIHTLVLGLSFPLDRFLSGLGFRLNYSNFLPRRLLCRFRFRRRCLLDDLGLGFSSPFRGGFDGLFAFGGCGFPFLGWGLGSGFLLLLLFLLRRGLVLFLLFRGLFLGACFFGLGACGVD